MKVFILAWMVSLYKPCTIELSTSVDYLDRCYSSSRVGPRSQEYFKTKEDAQKRQDELKKNAKSLRIYVDMSLQEEPLK